MINEKAVPPLEQWLLPAAAWWVLVLAGISLAALVVGYVIATLQHGPVGAIRVTLGVIKSGMGDLVRISPRRTIALAWLAVKESIRRRVVVGFGVFILVLLFAGWFLDPGSPDPAKLYLSFVLTATGYLVPLLALLLSAFSLPNDIRTRTLYTVVTKPVRASEIVLGRILGFATITTGLLIVMALLSYFFVVTGLSHTHTLTADDLRPTGTAEGGKRDLVGDTGRTNKHRHHIFIDSEGGARVDATHGHTHDLIVNDDGSYALSPPRGMLVARVPVYGKLAFRDRDGRDTSKGINVGDEWMYRSYIQGGSPAAAMWTFTNLTPERFPESLPLEATIGVFRTHKGEITRGVLGSISVRNPDTGLTVETEIFEAKEFAVNEFTIPRKITRFSSAQVISRQVDTIEGIKSFPPLDQRDPELAKKSEYDLFQDLVTADGRTEIWLRCLEPGQYFGAAEFDTYLRASNAPFWANFLKGYYGIWLQTILVIGFGVMFSTFLSGPVAMLATLGALLGGYFNDFMYSLAVGRTAEGDIVYGGGPVESLIRLVKQQNIMTEMDPSLGATVAQMMDVVLGYGLRVMATILPSFGDFSYANYVASGFDVAGNVILVRTVTALAFLIPVFIAGYLCLKNREVAQ